MPVWVLLLLILLNVPAVSNIPDHAVAWDDYIILDEGHIDTSGVGVYWWRVDKTIFVGNKLDLPVELVITNCTFGMASQKITGKDRLGNMQSENIVLTSQLNGTYVTEQRWAHIDFIVFRLIVADFVLRYENQKIKGGRGAPDPLIKPIEWFVLGGVSFLWSISSCKGGKRQNES